MPICPKCGGRLKNKRADGNHWCRTCGCHPRGRAICRAGLPLQRRNHIATVPVPMLHPDLIRMAVMAIAAAYILATGERP